MDGILKKPYEISLWQEDLVWHRRKLELASITEKTYEYGKYYSQNSVVAGTSKVPYTLDYTPYVAGRKYYSLAAFKNGNYVEGATSDEANKLEDWSDENTLLQYYKECKLCVIGSNTMTAPIRAVSPKFVSNVNGSHTLTFTVYSHYWDEDSNSLQWNPFMRYLTNERKVKLKYNNKWYDFVIKNISEDSSSKAFTYTCKDVFVNELSKSGFELVFDNELENNMGTLNELAKEIYKDSDWEVKDSLVVKQYLEEPVYRAIVVEPTESTKAIEATKMYGEEEKVTIDAGKVVYIFYSSFADKDNGANPQFLYDPTQKYQLDDANIIIGHTNDTPNGVYNFKYDSWEVFKDIEFAPTMRGKRIVESQKSHYDAKIDKTVLEYNDGQVCGFKEVEYISPSAVRNLVSNSSSFTSTSGWIATKGNNSDTRAPELKIEALPAINKDNFENWKGTSYLKFTPTVIGQFVLNTGISANRRVIGQFVKGEKYWLRADITNEDLTSFADIKMSIAQYTIEHGRYVKGDEIFSINFNSDLKAYDCTCESSIPEETLYNNNYAIFIKANSTDPIYIKNLEFFKQEKVGDIWLTPEMENFNAEVKTTWKYFNSNLEYSSLEDLVFSYVGHEPNTKDYKPYYGAGERRYEKVRSITAKESNRFNLTQTLCELFECWCRFDIEHDSNGTILLDDNLRQKKWVSFHEYIGANNPIGFRYGTNLKSIKRTLDSNGAISKIIVKTNSNEFAPRGFCTIARAEENPSGESFIYNFDYYVGQGLLDFEEINNDLNGSRANGWLGLHTELRALNQRAQTIADEYAEIGNSITNFESQYKAYKESHDAAQKDLFDQEYALKVLTDHNLEELFADTIDGETEEDKQRREAWPNNPETQKILAAIARDKTVIAEHGAIFANQYALWQEAKNKKIALEEENKDISRRKIVINKEFYKKYSRFIQEGSWISEDYIDDNLYYIDALSTLYTSSRPQVNYTIDVVELSALPEFENYNFEVGDKTFVEDEEFFGRAYDGSKRLYREEVIISETSIELESPEKNSIKVQNYKTQFEDLFQRVVATTQQVQFSTGEYQRSAAIVQPGGIISSNVLQNSLINNALILENARDQSVIMNENGITATNISRPSEMLRIVAGGILLSLDGGANWTTGISASGINANAIKTGQLNAGEVNITMGDETAFRWDLLGISAYKRDNFGIDNGTFTRFDQFGLYGIMDQANFDALAQAEGNRAIAMNLIEENAKFGLTWDKFWLKSNGTNGYVSISSDKDFEVVRFNDDKEKISVIQIGRLDNDEDYYGIRINDLTGTPVMESDNNGQLWLRKQLQVQTDEGTSVVIGLGGIKDDIHGKEIINANGQFRVYEDGYLVGENVQLKGIIDAEGGSIGGLSVEQWKDMGFSVRIKSSAGSILKAEDTTLTATLYQGTEEYSLKDRESLTYQWYRNKTALADKTAQDLLVELKDLAKNETAVYTCTITLEIKGGAS